MKTLLFIVKKRRKMKKKKKISFPNYEGKKFDSWNRKEKASIFIFAFAVFRLFYLAIHR